MLHLRADGHVNHCLSNRVTDLLTSAHCLDFFVMCQLREILCILNQWFMSIYTVFRGKHEPTLLYYKPDLCL
jgi:hypothetical protein